MNRLPRRAPGRRAAAPSRRCRPAAQDAADGGPAGRPPHRLPVARQRCRLSARPGRERRDGADAARSLPGRRTRPPRYARHGPRPRHRGRARPARAARGRAGRRRRGRDREFGRRRGHRRRARRTISWRWPRRRRRRWPSSTSASTTTTCAPTSATRPCSICCPPTPWRRTRWRSSSSRRTGAAPSCSTARCRPTGASPTAFATSARKFGAKVVATKQFAIGNDPRRRDEIDVSLMTSSDDYDVVFLADTGRDFGRFVPWQLSRPRPVDRHRGPARPRPGTRWPSVSARRRSTIASPASPSAT